MADLDFMVGSLLASWRESRKYKKALERLKYLENKYKDYPEVEPVSRIERGTTSTLRWLFLRPVRRARQLERARARLDAVQQKRAELSLHRRERDLRRRERKLARAQSLKSARENLAHGLLVTFALFGVVMFVIMLVIGLAAGPHHHR